MFELSSGADSARWSVASSMESAWRCRQCVSSDRARVPCLLEDVCGRRIARALCSGLCCVLAIGACAVQRSIRIARAGVWHRSWVPAARIPLHRECIFLHACSGTSRHGTADAEHAGVLAVAPSSRFLTKWAPLRKGLEQWALHKHGIEVVLTSWREWAAPAPARQRHLTNV